MKAPELIGLLRDRGVEVTCVLTKGGQEFITSLSLASLTGNRVYDSLFSLTDEVEMGHIALSRAHDLLVVAPASADIMAKLANGLADDLASTLLLATDKPVLVAPAMNVKMWEHPATQRNVAQLQQDGVTFIGPGEGALACGEEGQGRMAEPEEIAAEIERYLTFNAMGVPLAGYKALITSGPTIEALDPVRYITNRSSGKQGYAIAAALQALGAEVNLIAGPTSLPDPAGVNVLHVESASEMLDACNKALPVDIAVCAAAVSDWKVAEPAAQKIKKAGQGEDLTFTFMENPDILECISKHQQHRPRLVIGFAAETEHVVAHATKKRKKKGCDWMLANDVSGGKVFNSEQNVVHFISDHDSEEWPKMSKEAVAQTLAQKVLTHFQPKVKLQVVEGKA